MCIAIVIPGGIPLPDVEETQRCWDRNPDGAGFAYSDGAKLVVHKGFTYISDFQAALMSIPDTFQWAALHFRIGTAGGLTPQNTHPFPVSSNPGHLQALDYECPAAIIHNGVLPLRPRRLDMSDTAELAALLAESGNPAQAIGLVGKLVSGNNRLAYLTPKAYTLYGAWIAEDGRYYSNDGFRKSHSRGIPWSTNNYWSYTRKRQSAKKD